MASDSSGCPLRHRLVGAARPPARKVADDTTTDSRRARRDLAWRERRRGLGGAGASRCGDGVALGAAVCGRAAVDRRRAARLPAHMAPSLRQDRRGLGGRGGACAGRRVWVSRGACRLRACHAGGISELHRAALRALHRRRRDPRHRQRARHAGHEHRDPGARHGDREHRRHDGCCDDPDPAAAQGQCRAAAQRACRRVLHHPGRQCRRGADAARRPAALRRLPARRRLFLDRAASVAADGHRGGAASDGLCRRRHVPLPPRAARPTIRPTRRRGCAFSAASISC